MPDPTLTSNRFIMVSGYFPPIVGGATTVVVNLLHSFDPDRFWVFAEKPDCFEGTHNAEIPPKWRVDHFGVPAALKRIPYGTRIVRFCRFGLVPAITMRICKRARAINAGCIIAVFPSWPFYISAYYAHRLLGIPLYTYHLDAIPKPHELNEPDTTVYGLYHEKILRAATGRLVLSEALGNEFKREFGLDSKVIPHSLDFSRVTQGAMNPDLLARCGGKRLIVHTGAVADLQIDGLLRIAKAIKENPQLNAKLVLSTPSDREEVISHGLDPKEVEIVFLKKEEVFALQRHASALLVTLPFTHRSDERTPFPTKTVEYMASGTPILAHVPTDSYLAGHIAQYGYALVAASEQELPRALKTILDDCSLRERLAQNAQRTARELFSIEKIATRFAGACGLEHLPG